MMRVTLPGTTVDVPDRVVGVFRDEDTCGIHGAQEPDEGKSICARCWTNGTAAFGNGAQVSLAHLLTLRIVTRALMHVAPDPSAAIVRQLRILLAANRSELAA